MSARFWVGGTGTWDGSNTTNWSASSGGSSGASVPTSADAVFFNGSSGSGTVSIASGNCASIDFSGSALTVTSPSVTNVKGSVTLGSGTYTGLSISSDATSSLTLTSNGKTLSGIAAYNYFIAADAVTLVGEGLSLGPQSNVTLKAGTTNTFQIINYPSSAVGGGVPFIKSDSPGTRATISDNSGTNNVNYLTVTDIAFTGGATWYWGTGAIDGGNNTGISASAAVAVSNILFRDFA